MSRTHLDEIEVKELHRLFDAIKLDLSDSSFPTRTNRLEAVENMKKVIQIHGYDITGQKTEEELSEDEDQDIYEPLFPDSKKHLRKRLFPDARDQHLINKNFNKATGGK
jgi:hypothetical protein